MQKRTEMAQPEILYFIGLFHEIFWQHYKRLYILRSILQIWGAAACLSFYTQTSLFHCRGRIL